MLHTVAAFADKNPETPFYRVAGPCSGLKANASLEALVLHPW
jgi:hypothetical protein